MGIISNSSIGGSLVDPAVKGDITTFSNSIVNLGIAPALTGKVLTQNITTPTGLEWKSPVGTKGGLLTNDGTNTKQLPVGTNNKVLTANSSATDGTGLEWKTPVNLNFVAKGDIESFDGSVPKILSVGGDNQVLTANNSATSGVGLEWKTPVNLNFVAKGDLESFDGSVSKILPVGTVGQLLTANPSATSGVAMEWDDNKVLLLTQKADLLSAVAGTVTKLAGATGTDGQVLTKKLSETVGMEWATPSGTKARQVFMISRPLVYNSATANVALQPIPFNGNESDGLGVFTTANGRAKFTFPFSGIFSDFKINVVNVSGTGTDQTVQLFLAVNGNFTDKSISNSLINGDTGFEEISTRTISVSAGDILEINVQHESPIPVLEPIELTLTQFSFVFTES